MGKKGAKLKPPGLTDQEGNDGSSQSLETPARLGSAPTAAEAEAATKSKVESKTAAAAPTKPSVPLRVYAEVSGIKPDQIKAFARYAQLEEMRPCPIPQWKDRYEAFLQKPIRG